MNTELHFSSKTDDWATPQAVFDELDKEFNFTLDPCASQENHKCEKFFTKEDDGLKQNWQGERIFCNPPYGRVIKDWVQKMFSGGVKSLLVFCLPEQTQSGFMNLFIRRQRLDLLRVG